MSGLFSGEFIGVVQTRPYLRGWRDGHLHPITHNFNTGDTKKKNKFDRGPEKVPPALYQPHLALKKISIKYLLVCKSYPPTIKNFSQIRSWLQTPSYTPFSPYRVSGNNPLGKRRVWFCDTMRGMRRSKGVRTRIIYHRRHGKKVDAKRRKSCKNTRKIPWEIPCDFWTVRRYYLISKGLEKHVGYHRRPNITRVCKRIPETDFERTKIRWSVLPPILWYPIKSYNNKEKNVNEAIVNKNGINQRTMRRLSCQEGYLIPKIYKN